MAKLKALIIIATCGSSLSASALAVDIDVFGWGCLEDTEQHAAEYGQCQSVWNRNDPRCRAIGYNMHQAMEACRSKGVADERIEAAMKKGFRNANVDAIPGVEDSE